MQMEQFMLLKDTNQNGIKNKTQQHTISEKFTSAVKRCD